MSFDQIMAFVLKHEGGYVNDPRDPGGETKYGISKRAYPRVNIKALTLEGAREIYRRDYWDRLGGIEDDLCRMAAFDTAVNCGISRAILWARRADEDWKALLQIRRSYYRGLADRRRAMMKYLRGWVNRVDDLEAFLDTLIQKNATPQEALQGGQI